MRILVAWDQAAEAEMLDLYLNVDENTALITLDIDSFLHAAKTQTWDVVLMAFNFPSPEKALGTFETIRKLAIDAPVVGACRPVECTQIARFMARGLRTYVTRDDNGEFMFLLTPMLESAFEAMRAEKVRQLSDRLRQEIDSVRRLQESMIPRSLPEMRGFRVAARYETSQIQVVGNQPVVMAGGDYYDLFNIDGERLVFLVGDASGHGMRACMSIMTMHTLISMMQKNCNYSTATFVEEVNRQLCENNIIQDQGGFITFLYCVLDLKTNRLSWTSAGHPMPILHDLDTGDVRMLARNEQGGLPLGISTDIPYEVCEADLTENCRLLLYTDGLAEAFYTENNKTYQFGEKRIMQTLLQSANIPLEASLDGLFRVSSDWTRGEGRHDDTSIVLVERTAVLQQEN